MLVLHDDEERDGITAIFWWVVFSGLSATQGYDSFEKKGSNSCTLNPKAFFIDFHNLNLLQVIYHFCSSNRIHFLFDDKYLKVLRASEELFKTKNITRDEREEWSFSRENAEEKNKQKWKEKE
jgi:hypothetical protein